MDTSADKHAAGERLTGFLREARRLRAERAASARFADTAKLKTWQAARLARTHADLLADPRYGPAATFFLSDLYGPADFTARDGEIARVVPLLVRMLPVRALDTLGDALRMDALSESLDDDVTAALGRAGRIDRIDDEAYARAYRACGRAADRELQIALTNEIGVALDRLTRMPMLGATLHLMKVPAEMAGLGALQSFLQRGFDAFRHMRGAEHFLSTINTRETTLMRKWLGA